MNWQKSPIREALGKTLVELGDKYPNMVIVNADLRNSVKTIYFMAKYPERTIEVLSAAEARYAHEVIVRKKLMAGETTYDLHGLGKFLERNRRKP